MKTEVKRFDSSEGNVWKYVFDFGTAVAEAVLYRYESFQKRTVMCVSVQSGCPVGCTFCGTGSKFIRSLTTSEITYHVQYMMNDMGLVHDEIEKLQVMFMSMGEPLLNFDEVKDACVLINHNLSNAQLLISTIGPNDKDALLKLLQLSEKIDKIGLQFSIHRGFDNERNELIPFKNKLSLRQIRDYGIEWSELTGRPAYLNYCVGDDNHSESELNRIKDIFPPKHFYMTFSVICETDENMKDVSFQNLDLITEISNGFLAEGYNVRVFNPAGQDDIGGGCGQLWFTQEWLKNH